MTAKCQHPNALQVFALPFRKAGHILCRKELIFSVPLGTFGIGLFFSRKGAPHRQQRFSPGNRARLTYGDSFDGTISATNGRELAALAY